MANPNVGTKGTSEILTDFPAETGLGLLDKHEGRKPNLAAEKGTHVPKRESVGMGE